MNRNSLSALLPDNLDLQKLVEDKPPSFHYELDDFRYIIGLLYEIPIRNKDLVMKGGYVPINSAMLQQKIRDYAKYIQYLIANGVFETDNQFIVGKKCRGYRFADKYQVKCKSEVISKTKLVKQINAITPRQREMEKRYKFLKKWFNPKLKIDADKALDFLYKEYKQDLVGQKDGYKWKFLVSTMVVERIVKSQFNFSIDEEVGRCHTNLTNCKSELRNFITYDGRKMVSVDISNSQPCFSGILFNSKFYIDENEIGNEEIFNCKMLARNKNSKSFKILVKQSKIIEEIINYITLVKSSESVGIKGFQPYLENVQKGHLYQHVQAEIKAQNGIDVKSKKEIKEIVFRVLFTDNRFIGQPAAEPKRIFRSIFPDVYKLYSIVKRKDSTLLPRLLQSIEAKLILDYVAKRISKEMPDLPIFTIHDSIACPVGYEDYVAQVIKEEMMLRIGMSPTVKYEYWTPENLIEKTIGKSQVSKAA